MVPKHANTPQNHLKTEKIAKLTTSARQAMVFIIFYEFIDVTLKIFEKNIHMSCIIFFFRRYCFA